MFDDEHTVLDGVEHPAYGGIRTPDGRALTWAEYGSARGVPVLLIPDAGSSRLAPAWLLHDSALPSSVRLLALDRPGTGASDPIGLGGLVDPADDLRRVVETLAVGRIAVIGIGQGADEAFAFAAAYPRLVAMVSGVSVRIDPPAPARRRRLLRAGRRPEPAGLLGQWALAGGGADLRQETTWRRMIGRLGPQGAAVLAALWQEADFRAAVAADLDQRGRDWSGTTPAAAPAWSARADAVAVPVRLWHGQGESSDLDAVRRVTDGRPGWSMSVVSGPSATLGYWPQILAVAAAAFSTATAA